MRYFELNEFLESDTAKAYKIDNFPSFKVVANLEALVENILDPLREKWGSGLIVSSGFRCEALNKKVGGSATSAHKLGLAADIVPANGKINEFIEFAENWLRTMNVPFDQSIDEKDKKGNHWWHIGLCNSDGKQRRMFMNLTKK